MDFNQIASHLVHYSFQLALILGISLLLPKMLGLRSPSLRLSFYYLLLAIILIVPAAELFPVVKTIPEITVQLNIDSIIADSTATRRGSLVVPLALSALALVALVRLALLCVGLVVLASIRRSSRVLDPEPGVIRCLEFRLGCRVTVRSSERLKTPASFGWRRGTVLVPTTFLNLEEEEQEAILCHEILHLRRSDWPVALLEQFIQSVLWFHPLVLVLLDRIHLAREQVVDREVIRITGRRRAYLEALRHSAETFRQASVAPTIPFIRASHLKHRVTLLAQEVRMSPLRHFVSGLVLISSPVLLSAAALAAFPSTASSTFSAGHSALLLSVAGRAEPGYANTQQEKEEKEGHIVLSEETDTRTKLIKRVNPVYPEEAKEQHITGKVVARIRVDEEGKVADVTIEQSPHESLSQAADDAIRQWEWEPATKDGQPVSFLVRVTINFALK